MKKVLAIALAAAMVLSMAACGKKAEKETTTAATKAETTTAATEAETTAAETEAETTAEDTTAEAAADGSMSYAEYAAAAIDDEVNVTCYVQAHQSWWDNKVTVYAADQDGAYFMYEMACSEEDAEKLTPGTCINVTGYKSEWAGEVEIVDAEFTFVDGADSYIAEAIDVTPGLDDAEALLSLQNALISVDSVVVESVAYKNGEPGDDIYLTVSQNGKTYDFCLEYYLNGSDEELYNKVGGLQKGEIVNLEGFLYWYNGMNPHITAVDVTGSLADTAVSAMSYADYTAAAIDDEVTITAWVQDHQSWWDNKITVYLADADGAYFAYEMECSEEDAAKLVPGTLITMNGYKGEWSGEVEIVDATFTINEGAASYIAPAKDITEDLANAADYQNQLVTIKGLTVESVSYKNDEPGDDIYVSFSKDGEPYEFCLEYYLNGSDEDFYALVGGLEAGAVVDVTGYLYWYNGMNVHMTEVVVNE